MSISSKSGTWRFQRVNPCIFWGKNSSGNHLYDKLTHPWSICQSPLKSTHHRLKLDFRSNPDISVLSTHGRVIFTKDAFNIFCARKGMTEHQSVDALPIQPDACDESSSDPRKELDPIPFQGCRTWSYALLHGTWGRCGGRACCWFTLNPPLSHHPPHTYV